jgi:cell division transport system permease protein
MAALEPLQTMAEPWDNRDRTPSRAAPPPVTTPIVPSGSIAGRSLTALVAIMTFLAALTTGAVMMVVSAANDWQSEVGREVTIQVRPVPGRDFEADVSAAVALARTSPGIAEVRPYSKEDSAALIEPWLGSGLALNDLPIPRMIVVKLLSGTRPDFSALRKALAAQIPNASFDDHRGWIERMRAMADTAVIVGIAVLTLVLTVTILSVTFATRGAMAANRTIVEVLHYVGATDGFVASQFQRHFLALGLRGGAIGGGAAIALFGFLQAANAWLAGTAGGDEISALFGSFSVGAAGYIVIISQVVLTAAVTALTSRHTVNRTLRSIE